MSQTHIRPAVFADAEQIAGVHVRAWQSAYRGLMPQDYLDELDVTGRVALWRDIMKDASEPYGRVVVATTGAEIVGFAGYGPTRDPDGDPARTGEVAAIYLDPRTWSKGVGRQLMAAAVERLTGAGYADATLWVLDTNARARRFYEAGGWKPDGASKVDDRHGFPLTELRYRKNLNPI